MAVVAAGGILGRYVLSNDAAGPEKRFDRGEDQLIRSCANEVDFVAVGLGLLARRPPSWAGHGELDGRRDDEALSLKGDCDELLERLHRDEGTAGTRSWAGEEERRGAGGRAGPFGGAAGGAEDGIVTKVRTTLRPSLRQGREAATERQARSQGPTRLARQLALARHVERLIEGGELRDYAEAAETLGLTRARLTQVMKLLLAPVIQQAVLAGRLPRAARRPRAAAARVSWQAQMDVLAG